MEDTGSVLITGGTGYIGGSFALYYHKKTGRKPVVVSIEPPLEELPEVFTFYQCDIADYEQLRGIISRHQVKAVFHFAAFIEVGESVKNPLKYFQNNVGKTVELLRAVRDAKIRHFVFSSSAAVYGSPAAVPIEEAHALNPISPYGRTKAMVEQILQDFAKSEPGFSFVALRYFNVAGCLSKKTRHGELHLPESHVVPVALDVAMGLRPHFAIFGTNYDTRDGSCVRDFVDVKDICSAHLLAYDYLLKHNQSQVINLGSEKGFTVKELLAKVKEVTKKDFKVEEAPQRPGDPPALVASNKLAGSLLGWAPKRSLDKMIQKAWAWNQIKYDQLEKLQGFNPRTLVQKFQQHFPEPSRHGFRLFFAPGRINLIGDHTDYNGGFVFPCCVDKGTFILARKNDAKTVNVYSDQFKDLKNYRIENFDAIVPEGKWSDYFAGCGVKLFESYSLGQGFDAVVWGNLPVGAGLSSSASFCLVSLLALARMNELPLDLADPEERSGLVTIARWVENQYLGIKTGAMDQYTIAHGERDHALLLDCSNLRSQPVLCELPNYEILVCNTNLTRELRKSKYNERWGECQSALQQAKKLRPEAHLAHFDSEAHNKSFYDMLDPKLVPRVRHVLTENVRVKKAAESLRSKDVGALGRLITESGHSLRTDFEVTGEHLDWVVEAALAAPGVAGARMMGAGFGGCALLLVERGRAAEVCARVGQQYRAKSGIEPQFYKFRIGDGFKEILL